MPPFLLSPIRDIGRGCLFGAGCRIGVIVGVIFIGLFFSPVSGKWIGNLTCKSCGAGFKSSRSAEQIWDNKEYIWATYHCHFNWEKGPRNTLYAATPTLDLGNSLEGPGASIFPRAAVPSCFQLNQASLSSNCLERFPLLRPGARKVCVARTRPCRRLHRFG